MKNIIHPDHFYIPKAENDLVRAEVQRIFIDATQTVLADMKGSLESKAKELECEVNKQLVESFTSKHARPRAAVEMVWDGDFDNPVFMLGAMVYGHQFIAPIK